MNETSAEDPLRPAAPSPAGQLPAEPTAAEAAAESGAALAPAEPAPEAAELPPAVTARRLAELFPALFGAEAKPIKLRIHADIQQRAPGVFTRKSLSVFLHRHTTSTAYLKALVASPTRYDLDGAACGEAADEHREAARHELVRRRQAAEVRRAAERTAAQEAARVAQELRREQIKAERKAHREAAREWERKKAEGLAADIERERQRVEAEAHSQERRDRAALLRAWETTTLTRANFLALKRMSSTQFDEQIALARAEARQLPPRP